MTNQWPYTCPSQKDPEKMMGTIHLWASRQAFSLQKKLHATTAVEPWEDRWQWQVSEDSLNELV